MALCTIQKASNRNSSDDEKHLATTREQMRYGNGKLHYIFLADRSWRLHRVNPPGNVHKATRRDDWKHNSMLWINLTELNPMFYKWLSSDSKAHPATMRYFKRTERREAGVNREHHMF